MSALISARTRGARVAHSIHDVDLWGRHGRDRRESWARRDTFGEIVGIFIKERCGFILFVYTNIFSLLPQFIFTSYTVPEGSSVVKRVSEFDRSSQMSHIPAYFISLVSEWNRLKYTHIITHFKRIYYIWIGVVAYYTRKRYVCWFHTCIHKVSSLRYKEKME